MSELEHFRSDVYKCGLDRANARDKMKAAGITKEQIYRPFIGIANSYTNIFAGHSMLDKVTRAVSDGILMAGGTPVEFGTISICDAICQSTKGMKYSLPSREVIANSVESMAIAHGLDAVVLVTACDKITPGMLIGALRADIPTIVICGGPSVTGKLHGEPLKDKTNEAILKVNNGQMTRAEFDELEDAQSPGCGSCRGMFTANSMACITEALGLALPGNGTIPAITGKRLRLAKYTGMRAVELAKNNIKPSDIVTREAVENAIKFDMMIGCSTNTTLHIPAIAGALGYDVSIDDFDRLSKVIPQIVKLCPASKFDMENFDDAGGVSAVLKQAIYAGYIDGNQKSVTGMTIGETVADAKVYNSEIIRSFDNPYSKEGGIFVLKGNLAPLGSVIKAGAVAKEMYTHTGPARVYNSEPAAVKALERGEINKGDVMVIRYEGPKGGPGMQEMLTVTSYICGSELDKHVALVTDGRFSGATHGAAIGHVSPEAAQGGPLCLVEEGDLISYDLEKRTLELLVDEETLAKRREKWVCPQPEIDKGWLKVYARNVGPVAYGAQVK